VKIRHNLRRWRLLCLISCVKLCGRCMISCVGLHGLVCCLISCIGLHGLMCCLISFVELHGLVCCLISFAGSHGLVCCLIFCVGLHGRCASVIVWVFSTSVLRQSCRSWLCLLKSGESELCWLRGTVVERRSLTGELSLSYVQPAADGWPLN